ncbi:MAG: 1-acyl-sn-glycerol-3-phosphate acyltransferase [Alphaproteobacteria bacterium]|nr:1-acyl-sn-glycerol-3-phosphate acyltransferase [Alphaproteobacteria bacterium]
MTWLRSLIFNLAFWLTTAVYSIGGLPVLAASPPRVTAHGRQWARSVLGLLGAIAGLRHNVRGQPHAGPAIYASKHQSSWDTLIFQDLVPGTVFVVKRELLWLPFVGLFIWRSGHIAVDRRAGGQALKAMLRQADAIVAAGRSIVIFPEGTRTEPGSEAPYHPGVTALYKRLGLPVVPVALDSGLFWGRRQFVKQPGLITLEFLQPIPPGLDRAAFETRLRERIEAGSKRLLAEARARDS